MEWLLTPWGFWAAPPGAYRGSRWAGTGLLSPPADAGWRAEPSTVDLDLIRSLYEVLAGDATCARCGAPLGRRLRVVSRPAGEPPRWATSVVTRCRGWRRHRHTADVIEESKDLRFGPLRPTHAPRPSSQRQ
jgi:hypothetical protein